MMSLQREQRGQREAGAHGYKRDTFVEYLGD